MTEVWREISINPAYRVSSFGRVEGPGRHGKRGVLKLSNHLCGYLNASIWNGRKMATYTVHRLVLIAFSGQPKPGMQAAHLNGNRKDNRLENLKWCYPKENNAHKKIHGTSQSGERHGQAKLTNVDVFEIRKRFRPEQVIASNAMDLAKEFGVAPETIRNIVRRKAWKHI